MLDYVEMACKQISKRFVKPPDWWAPPTKEGPPPSLRKPETKCYEDKKNDENSRFCVRCQEEVEEEDRLREEERQKAKDAKKGKTEVKLSYRERMKRRAAESNKKKKEAAAAKRQKTSK